MKIETNEPDLMAAGIVYAAISYRRADRRDEFIEQGVRAAEDLWRRLDPDITSAALSRRLDELRQAISLRLVNVISSVGRA